MKLCYDAHMRTTISLPEELGERARLQARRESLSLSAIIARALRRHLSDPLPRGKPAPPFHLVTVGGSGTLPGVDLDRSSGLLVAEDEVVFGRPRGVE
jgi:hypothetical protein